MKYFNVACKNDIDILKKQLKDLLELLDKDDSVVESSNSDEYVDAIYDTCVKQNLYGDDFLLFSYGKSYLLKTGKSEGLTVINPLSEDEEEEE